MKTDSAAPTEARVLEILDEYLDELRAGRAPDRGALLARHPELSESLAASFRALDFVYDAQRTLEASEESSSRDEPASAGRVLGDYRLVRELGRGGMAVVYEAEQISLARHVALKVLPFAAVLDPKQLQRFKNEAQAAAHLHHPHIVPVHAVGCERGVHYYAMQYVEGQSLAVAIHEMKDAGAASEGPKTPISSHGSNREPAYIRMAAALGVQAAEALDHAHQCGIVHRDVKPGNLLVDLAGTLWVTDFGLAHSMKDVGLTMTGELLGTIRYMSPEQALAKRVPIDHRTDVYSLGATLYELFTLEPAFPGDDPHLLIQNIASKEPVPPRQINPALPRDVETILLKAMSKDPTGRYATAQDLADDLQRFLDNLPIAATRPGLVRRAAKWSRRHRALVGVAVGVLLLAVAGLATGAALLWREQEQTQTAFGRAEANLALALKALDEIYLDKAAVDTRIREGLPRDLLQRGLGFYEEFARENAQSLYMTHLMGDAYYRVSMIYQELGQGEKAGQALDRALATYREALRREPSHANAHYGLAQTLHSKGDSDAAIQEFRATIRLQPDHSPAHNGLGVLLRDIHRNEALQEFREAIRLEPNQYGLHFNLGLTLSLDGDLAGALRAYRDSVRLNPDFEDSHFNLGRVLKQTGDNVGAIAEFREAARLKPDDWGVHYYLGTLLKDGGDFDGSIPELRESIRLEPTYGSAHFHLGIAIKATGDVEGAILEYREAIRLQPDHAEAHCNLGHALRHQGRYKEALSWFRKGHELGSKRPDWAYPSRDWLDSAAKLAEAEDQLDGVLSDERRPRDSLEQVAFAQMLYAKSQDVESERMFAEAFLAEAHYNLGKDLHEERDLHGAIGSYREAIRLKPDDALAHYDLGRALLDKCDLDGAIRAFHEATRLQPDHAEAHCNLGHALRRQGRYKESLPWFRKGHELGSKRPGWAYPSHEWIDSTAMLAEVEDRLDQALSGVRTPRDPLERISFAEVLYAKSRHAESARMYSEAFAEDATLTEDPSKGHRYNAACSASLASARGEADAADWRGRALEWLRDDLAAREKAPSDLGATLDHWKKDPDLASVRDHRDDLPEPEREAWRALWAGIDEALARAARTSR